MAATTKARRRSRLRSSLSRWQSMSEKRRATRSSGLLRCGGTRAILGSAQRQREEERAALSWHALCPDLPSVRVHDSLRNGEPQTGACPGGRPRLPEALEDMRELVV